VTLACVAAQEFRCAQIAGMHIIVHPDYLEELALHYENHGYFEELITLLDNGLSHERAHIGMYTELGVMYAKYKAEKLMDFIKMNTGKLNIPKLIHACERHYHWNEAVFLYMHYDEYDSAANTMMAHSPSAFVHDQFLMIMQKVSNMEIFYRAIAFYLQEQPMQLNSLLTTITPKVDHARVVTQVRKEKQLPLIIPYLKQVQQLDLPPVNEAINELYVEGEQYDDLRQSITDFSNFDQIALAQLLEKHELVEMRRICAAVYKKNKRYKQSIELSKADKMYKDAMETARDSGDKDLAEILLRFFVDNGLKECFAACLYSCYDLIAPDIAMELAWRKGMMDFAMPYMIQVLKEYTGRIDALDKKTQKREEAEEKAKSAPNDFVADYVAPMMGGPMAPGMLAITGSAPMQPVPQMGMNMGPCMGGMGPSMGMPNMGGMQAGPAPGAPQMFGPQF